LSRSPQSFIFQNTNHKQPKALQDDAGDAGLLPTVESIVERWFYKTPQEFVLPSFNHIGKRGEAQEEGDGMGNRKQQCKHLPHWGQAE